jgi:hypothetical protein
MRVQGERGVNTTLGRQRLGVRARSKKTQQSISPNEFITDKRGQEHYEYTQLEASRLVGLVVGDGLVLPALGVGRS